MDAPIVRDAGLDIVSGRRSGHPNVPPMPVLANRQDRRDNLILLGTPHTGRRVSPLHEKRFVAS